jgi:hypothetical protein
MKRRGKSKETKTCDSTRPLESGRDPRLSVKKHVKIHVLDVSWKYVKIYLWDMVSLNVMGGYRTLFDHAGSWYLH